MFRRAFCAIVVATLLLALTGGVAGAGGRIPVGAGSARPWACLYGTGYARVLPGAAAWDLEVVVVGDGWGKATPSLRSVRVTLDGRPLPAARVKFADAPWVRANGALEEADVLAVKSGAASAILGQPPAAGVFRRLEPATARLLGVISGARAPDLAVTSMAGVPGGVHWVDIALGYEVAGRSVALAQRVQVVTAAIPREPGWFPADLHQHTTFSDGKKTPAQRREWLAAHGYFIGYVTDHTDRLMQNDSFAAMSGPYPSACRDCSDLTTSMFPGVEMTVVAAGEVPAGDCLGYGVRDTAGLENKQWPPQKGLDRIDDNNGPLPTPSGTLLSSAGIAHPNGRPAWQDWSVQGYYGVELMSGIQTNFGLDSPPVRRWRDECRRLAGMAAGFRPAARTGSDYHMIFQEYYVTHVLLPSSASWYDATWDERWRAVSAAIRDGRTVISRKGSLAYITADGAPVGSSLERPTGGTVTFSVCFKPITKAKYTLALYQDDNTTAPAWRLPAREFLADKLFTQQVPRAVVSGPHYYWLHVSGGDYCYTTPIYITGTQGFGD